MAASFSLLCLLMGVFTCLAVPNPDHSSTSTIISTTSTTSTSSTTYNLPGAELKVNWNKKCKCGRKGPGRIVGGTETGVNEWPWQVALLIDNWQFCGGSLINDRYVLTAAHCVRTRKASKLTIRLAEHNLETSNEATVVTVSVSQIIMHPDHDVDSKDSDIALLKLSQPVQMSATVLPVCMPKKRPNYAGKMATATGWGSLSEDGTYPDELMEVTVPVLSNKDCVNTGYGNTITENMLCAGETGKDSCQGDSGGPLVYKKGSKHQLIGVTSWGIGCGDDNYPGIYTRVSKFLPWIKSNTVDGVYCKGMKL